APAGGFVVGDPGRAAEGELLQAADGPGGAEKRHLPRIDGVRKATGVHGCWPGRVGVEAGTQRDWRDPEGPIATELACALQRGRLGRERLDQRRVVEGVDLRVER